MKIKLIFLSTLLSYSLFSMANPIFRNFFSKNVYQDKEYQCDAGDSDACDFLGSVYENGMLVSKNQEKAFNYYNKACQLNKNYCDSQKTDTKK